MEDKETLEGKPEVGEDEGLAEESEIAANAQEESTSAEPDALAQAREEAEVYKDRWIRLAAEFDNYKKRTAREIDALVQSAGAEVIRDLLPILDAVDRAFLYREKGQEDSEGYRDGVVMIMEQLPRTLRNRNLVEIDPVGHPFDPNVHEALIQMPSEIHEAGMVAEVVEKGYRLGDRVLRPAKVVVSQGRPANTEEKKAE